MVVALLTNQGSLPVVEFVIGPHGGALHDVSRVSSRVARAAGTVVLWIHGAGDVEPASDERFKGRGASGDDAGGELEAARNVKERYRDGSKGVGLTIPRIEHVEG